MSLLIGDFFGGWHELSFVRTMTLGGIRASGLLKPAAVILS